MSLASHSKGCASLYSKETKLNKETHQLHSYLHPRFHKTLMKQSRKQKVEIKNKHQM